MVLQWPFERPSRLSHNNSPSEGQAQGNFFAS